MSPDLIWSGWIALFALFETAGLIARKSNGTFSARTRAWFHTNTTRGRWTFAITWIMFSAWYFVHILWHWNPF